MLLSNDVNNLSDTYALCQGLINSNPSINNLETCNKVSQKLQKRVKELKEENPYITFYYRYIQGIEY